MIISQDKSQLKEVNSKISDKKPKLNGIRNPKSFCYINSVIQMLNSIREFREFLYTQVFTEKGLMDDPIIQELRDIILHINDMNNRTTYTGKIKYLNSLKPDYLDEAQEDAGEFFILLIEYLQKAAPKIQKLFIGETKTVRWC